MLLLLARHADAGVSDHSRWPDDGDRPLTDLGRTTQHVMAQRLVDASLSPDAIVTSPLLRARQTAEIIANVCGVSVDDSASHAAFARKYNLPFALLADRKGEIASRYGSLRNFGFVKFAKRNTFLVDPHGKIARVYLGVNPALNTEHVTEDLKKLAA